MSKRLIIILGLVMALVLLSLITVQINWIRNAYIVKEQQFDQMVHQSLNNVVREISKQDAFNLIQNEMYHYSGNYSNTNSITSAPDTIGSISIDFYIQSNGEEIIIEDSLPYDQTIQTNNSDLQQKLVKEKKAYLESLIHQMFSRKHLLEERITKDETEAILNETLLDYGIDVIFEFAIINRSNRIIYQSNNFSPKEINSVYRVRLFPEDIGTETNYLDIYFPHKRSFIFRSMAFIGISSGILTLLIVFTFAFTLYVIFRQKRLSEIKNDFVNNMTHELKTPISTISLASQMLGDDSIPDELKNLDRISGILKQESKRLGYQVEKVLQIAAIDRGNLTLNLKTICLHKLIEEISGNFRIQIDNKGGLLIPSLHAERTNVKVDQDHLTNVISNLLDNAIKYTPKDPEIFIETRNIDNQIQVSVKDNGIGISKANQKKVFERFYRVPTGNVHNVKGFGLGLNYVKKIIEIHKGTIDLESEPGQGTTFSFRIPLKN